MATTYKRPNGLPEFTNPPLMEVVFGVQFQDVPGYHQLCAGGVWDLFKQEFPLVQEQAPLPTAFEIFGSQSHSLSAPMFPPFGASLHPRYWFCDKSGEELIQFQQNKLFHNWRRFHNPDIPYPRYENIMGKFKRELEALDGFFRANFTAPLVINQCEISYYNAIPIDPQNGPDRWLSLVNFSVAKIEDYNLSTREVCLDDQSQTPVGRLFIESGSGVMQPGTQAITLNLTFRGKPSGTGIDSAVDFISKGRSEIVRRFAECTTAHAHGIWGRTQ